MDNFKVSIIGAGFVGATAAQKIYERNLADVVLIDIVDGLAQGKALDMMESAPLEGYRCSIFGSKEYSDMKDSHIVVITAGLARKPGMSREDLLRQNASIVRPIAEKINAFAPDSIIIIVTNPLDVMTHLAYKASGFNERRVMGMAGVLDSARFRLFIAERLNVSVRDVQSMVLGSHGDMMVPLARYTTVSGIPITELLSKEEIDKLTQHTRDGGAEIVALLKTGSAYYAPASSIADMVESILKDERRILPACVLLKGEYEIKDCFCGVPIKLGRGGVEDIIELKLTAQELDSLKASAEKVKEGIRLL